MTFFNQVIVEIISSTHYRFPLRVFLANHLAITDN